MLLPVTLSWRLAPGAVAEAFDASAMAAAYASQGRFETELQYLIIATHYNGFEAAIWVRLGDSIMRNAGNPPSTDSSNARGDSTGSEAWGSTAAKRTDFPSSTEELALACEAMASYELASALDSPLGRDRHHQLAAVLQASAEGGTHNGGGGDGGTVCARWWGARYTAQVRPALDLVRSGSHLDAVRLVCSDQQSVTVSLSTRERARGIPTAATMRELFVVARVCGVVVLDGVFEAPVLDAVRDATAAHFDARRGALKAADDSSTGRDRVEMEDVASR